MLKSPKEDFAHSLEALPGTLEKLNYVSGLRQPAGNYFHWGMSRTHGGETASVTIAQAHSDLFSQALKTPLRKLWNEAEPLLGEKPEQGRELLNGLTGSAEAVVPNDLKGGSGRHFKSILLALSLLARSREQKTHPSA